MHANFPNQSHKQLAQHRKGNRMGTTEMMPESLKDFYSQPANME